MSSERVRAFSLPARKRPCRLTSPKLCRSTRSGLVLLSIVKAEPSTASLIFRRLSKGRLTEGDYHHETLRTCPVTCSRSYRTCVQIWEASNLLPCDTWQVLDGGPAARAPHGLGVQPPAGGPAGVRDDQRSGERILRICPTAQKRASSHRPTRVSLQAVALHPLEECCRTKFDISRDIIDGAFKPGLLTWNSLHPLRAILGNQADSAESQRTGAGCLFQQDPSFQIR